MAPGSWTATSADATPIGVATSGRGPALVLVHGTTADHTRWQHVTALLSADFTVHAVDRRGRGSSGDADAYALEREADDVAAVIDAVGGPVDVVGHSYGGLCVLEAARRGAGVRRMVAYEPPVSPDPRATDPDLIARMDAELAAGHREAVIDLFCREVLGMTPAQVDHARSQPGWPGRVAAAHTVPRELRAHADAGLTPSRWADVDVPALLLLGERSPAALRASVDQLAEALPRSRREELAGQGHVAMDTAPRLLADAITRFLREPEAPPG